MKIRTITDNVYWMGAVDWDRRLFDSLIPLPDGTSYNAYLIQGSEKTVLIDTVDPAKVDVLSYQLKDIQYIDYVIAQHAEQDHSGVIPQVLEKYTSAQVLTTPKGKGMLADHLCIPEDRITEVKDGETLKLGGKTLEFIHTPWVHWPETMSTYLQEDKILFIADQGLVYEAAKRYYAEIMMPFRRIIQKNLQKVKNRELALIAPSHGPIYDEPSFIIDAYEDWVSKDPKNTVVLPYISMHGSTRKMVEYLVSVLAEKGVTVHQFDLAVTDIGKLAIALVDAATIVIGTPTVHVGPHPLVFYATHLANALRPKLKFASIIGSYGWSSKAIEQIAGLIPNLKVEILDPVLCKGFPKQGDFAALEHLASTIANKHKEHNLI